MIYSIIVPVYNSQNSLVELYERVKAVFEQIVKADFELILVNDSSRDNSWNVMKDLHEKDERVKIINLAKNFGQHAALLCGLKYFSGDFVIMLDDDLQHPPEEIPKLIKALEENPEIDVVFGNYESKKHNWYRNLGSLAINKLGKVIGKRDEDIKVTSFRIIRTNLAHRIAEINIQQPRVGGYRYPSSKETLERREREDGSIRSDEDPEMDGPRVFDFTITKVPKDIKHIIESAGMSMDDITFFVFHQANLFIIKHISKKIKIPMEKVPLSLSKFGNLSSASLPLTMVSEMKGPFRERTPVLLTAFGVGLSWASAVVDLKDVRICKLLEV